MPRFFNTAGPCRPELHYMLSSSKRVPEVRALIEQQSYFVLHAPRQVGKTTALLTLAKELTQEGKYISVLVSMEVGAPFPDEPENALPAILESWRNSIEHQLPKDYWPAPWPDVDPGALVGSALSAWSRTLPKPLVIFLDEIDSLQDQTLISVLRQLRAGYSNRPEGFPQSLALIGMRDVRDYKVKSGGSERLHTASPFNIKVRSLTMRDFNREEVEELLMQHTQESGQVWRAGVFDRMFDLTQGQPWLVNALAKEVVEFLVPERSQAVELHHIEEAKEILIRRRDTHLDSLAERLRDDRVRAIIQPMMLGEMLPNIPDDDLRYVVDLGLCTQIEGGQLTIANLIYREVIPRVLTSVMQVSIPDENVYTPNWLDGQGKLLPMKLLEGFVEFWRQHGEALQASAPYPEMAPHLVCMAFLHRMTNGGGPIERDYAWGRKRFDLCIRYKGLVLPIESSKCGSRSEAIRSPRALHNWKATSNAPEWVKGG